MVPAGPPPTPPVVLVCPPPTPPVLHHLVYCPCWLVLTHTKPRHQAQANLSRQLLESGRNTRGPVDIVHSTCAPSCCSCWYSLFTHNQFKHQLPPPVWSRIQPPQLHHPTGFCFWCSFTHTRVKLKQVILTPTPSTSLPSTT